MNPRLFFLIVTGGAFALLRYLHNPGQYVIVALYLVMIIIWWAGAL